LLFETCVELPVKSLQATIGTVAAASTIAQSPDVFARTP
jgi:hypothetical protein